MPIKAIDSIWDEITSTIIFLRKIAAAIPPATKQHASAPMVNAKRISALIWEEIFNASV